VYSDHSYELSINEETADINSIHDQDLFWIRASLALCKSGSVTGVSVGQAITVKTMKGKVTCTESVSEPQHSFILELELDNTIFEDLVLDPTSLHSYLNHISFFYPTTRFEFQSLEALEPQSIQHPTGVKSMFSQWTIPYRF
jgi:hypothetical protein